jgi:hypothetical protein
VALGLLYNSPDSKAISEFSGMMACTLSLSWKPILEGTRFYIPCLKRMIFMWWKNATYVFEVSIHRWTQSVQDTSISIFS